MSDVTMWKEIGRLTILLVKNGMTQEMANRIAMEHYGQSLEDSFDYEEDAG